MHIVALGWLYVILAMSLTMGLAAGAAFFALAGVLPAGLLAALAVRRRRAQRERAEAARDGPSGRADR